MFSEVFRDREYDVEVTAPPGTILDLGSNIGVSALFFRRRFPDARIVAVEASPRLAELLRENTRALGVDVRAAAVAAEPGTVSFHDSGVELGGSTSADGGGGVTVPAIGLDDLLREVRPDLVKLDIEGAEFELLRTSRELARVPHVVGEIHAPPESPESVEALGAFADFRVTTNRPGPRELYTVFEAVRRSRSAGEAEDLHVQPLARRRGRVLARARARGDDDRLHVLRAGGRAVDRVAPARADADLAGEAHGLTGDRVLVGDRRREADGARVAADVDVAVGVRLEAVDGLEAARLLDDGARLVDECPPGPVVTTAVPAVCRRRRTRRRAGLRRTATRSPPRR